jgi:hypothetical protein
LEHLLQGTPEKKETIMKRTNRSDSVHNRSALLEEAPRTSDAMIETKRAAQDWEREARIARLKADLDAVRGSREAIRSEIEAMGRRRRAGLPNSPKSKPWISVALITSVCGFGLLFGWMYARADLKSSQPSKTALAGIERELTPREPTLTPAMSPGNPEAPLRPIDATEVVSTTSHASSKKGKPKTGKSKKGKQSGPVKKGPKGKERENKRDRTDDLGFLSNCGMDPMCGFDRK